MGWIPRYIVSGGMYGGANVPQGSLTGFINDFCTSKTAYSSDKSALGSKSTASGGARWAGAYGASDSLMREYALGHADGQFHEVDLFEIVVENPPGAQFYKQSIVISANIRCTAPTEHTREVEGVTYHCTSQSISIQITKIRSRNYATPYSDPTSQNIVTGINRGVGGWNYIIGDEEALSDNYNSIYEGIRVALGNFTFNNIEYFGCALYGEGHHRRSTGDEDVTDGGIGGVQIDKLNQVFGLFEPEETEDPNDDPETPKDEEDGGDGGHNRPVDPVPIPGPDNDHTAAGAGFITVYAPAPQQMRNFASDMFATTVWEAIKLFLGNPLDFIIGCLSIPYTPALGEAYYPKFGLVTFEHSMLTVTEQYKQLDFGSVYIEPYGNNCFDYSPYTKIQIWLPYIGYRELNTDEVMGKNVHVKYTCDCVSGSCVAFVSTQVKPQGVAPFAEVVIAQFEGNCGVQIPVGSVSFDNFIQTSIAGTVNGVVGIAQTVMGGEGNADKAVSQLSATTIGKITGLKPTVERSGSIASSAGKNSIEYPYIIRTFPKQSLPSNYKELFGYPSNIGGTLNDGFEGLAVVDEIQLNNIPAMETEREEIMEWLRKGVLL